LLRKHVAWASITVITALKPKHQTRETDASLLETLEWGLGQRSEPARRLPFGKFANLVQDCPSFDQYPPPRVVDFRGEFRHSSRQRRRLNEEDVVRRTRFGFADTWRRRWCMDAFLVRIRSLMLVLCDCSVTRTEFGRAQLSIRLRIRHPSTISVC